MPKVVQVTQDVSIGAGKPLLIIAGPCQIESLDHCLMIAEHVKKICSKLQLPFIFKSSFDKANRTALTGKRGIGIDQGLEVLAQVREQLGVPVITDIHSPDQAVAAAQVVDVLQTPAFLCRQTDLLIAAGKTGKCINVKKGQFLAPEDMRYVAEKIASTGNERILLCERGTCFGYRDLVVDLRGLHTMRDIGYPVVYDATHSVQSMGGAGGSSGGSREHIVPLARAAVAAGIDGIFIECHQNPSCAPSDGASMLELNQMQDVLTALCAIHQLVASQVPQSL